MREWPVRCLRAGCPEDQLPRRPPFPRFAAISEVMNRRRVGRLPELGLQLLLYAFWREVVEHWYQMGWVIAIPITGSGERVRHLLFLSLERNY